MRRIPRRLPAMSPLRMILALTAVGIPCAAWRAHAVETEAAAPKNEVRRFGPYEAIIYDPAMLADVKVDEKGDIFLLLRPDRLQTRVTIRISMQKGAAYRKWFTGEEVLEAQQNTTGRSPGVWSDRVQTTANFIEYWSGDTCFLHLKKSNS